MKAFAVILALVLAGPVGAQYPGQLEQSRPQLYRPAQQVQLEQPACFGFGRGFRAGFNFGFGFGGGFQPTPWGWGGFQPAPFGFQPSPWGFQPSPFGSVCGPFGCRVRR
jgi:hypothetical protein